MQEVKWPAMSIQYHVMHGMEAVQLWDRSSVRQLMSSCDRRTADAPSPALCFYASGAVEMDQGSRPGRRTHQRHYPQPHNCCRSRAAEAALTLQHTKGRVSVS